MNQESTKEARLGLLADRMGIVLASFGYSPGRFQNHDGQGWTWRKKIEGFDSGWVTFHVKFHDDHMASLQHEIVAGTGSSASIIKLQKELPIGDDLLDIIRFTRNTPYREVTLFSALGASRSAW